MNITTEHKKAIVAKLAEVRQLFTGSDAAFARAQSIDKAQYSRIKNGELDGVLSESAWITLARKHNVLLNGGTAWKTARTDVFEFITAQLEACQIHSMAGLLCDDAGIGKTYSAKVYAETHKNAIYVDCSQYKTKQRLIKHIAQEFGVGGSGLYTDTYEDLVFYLKTIANPLIILDEVGDLNHDAFLEIKALWNATEHCCAWYMMGADGLKRKIDRSIENKKVGFVEIFDRYGKKYQRATPLGGAERTEYIRRQAALIIKANAPQNADMQKILAATDGSLRRIYIEIQKHNHTSAS